MFYNKFKLSLLLLCKSSYFQPVLGSLNLFFTGYKLSALGSGSLKKKAWILAPSKKAWIPAPSKKSLDPSSLDFMNFFHRLRLRIPLQRSGSLLLKAVLRSFYRLRLPLSRFNGSNSLHLTFF